MTVRVIVVEDEPGVRLFVARTLADRGYSVASFGRVAEAAATVREGAFDLLIADVELPDGCGLDLIAMLPAERGIPAIVMSALSAERDFGRGFAAGAADYIGKPFPADELLARCARHTYKAAARREATAELEPAERLAFGRYRIERELGRGSYGRVFLARDTGLQDRRVALKVLTPPPGEEGDAKLRFVRETLTLSRVNDPGVVRVLDVGEAEGRLYYTMEYLEGETLEDYVVTHGPLNEAEARAVASGLLRALSALKAAGIVHRDLKPSNVILRSNDLGRPVLVDFGLATNERDRRSTQAGQLLGTPAFMSPEVIQGSAADHQSDLFSLGLTLRFALTGECAFDESGIRGLMAAIVSEPISLPHVPMTGSFAVFLDWLWAIERSSRAPSARAALRALDAIDAGFARAAS
jgi:DNA-binding response OmpR family regulator